MSEFEKGTHPYWDKIREKYQDKIIKLRKEKQELIEEFIKDIKREIRYIKTINNYQDFAGELKQCIWVEKLEEQLNRNIIEKWEKR